MMDKGLWTFSIWIILMMMTCALGIVCDFMSKQEDRLLQITLKEMELKCAIGERNKGK